MYYIFMGIMLAIGWYLVRIVYDIVCEVLFSRLHKADWYLVVAGKKPSTTQNKPGDLKTVKNEIGFHYTEKVE